MMDNFCTEECKIVSKEEAKRCFDYNHKIIQVRSDEEIKKFEKDYGKNDRFTFQSSPKKDVFITETILDYNIIPLRPIFYNYENGKRMILVYLPTKIKKEKGNDEDSIITFDFANKAYFVVQNPKPTVRLGREILPIDDVYFKDKFKINIQPEWNDTRWENSDLKKWIRETSLTDPKLIYELLDKTCRKYLEFASEQEYIKFILWNIGTYCYELFDCYPYNDFTGLKGSGKTKCIEFQKLVCYNAVLSPDITSSATFRIIQGLGCTLLLDETEQFKNQKNDRAQNVRTILIQGFLKDQFAIRNESKQNGTFIPTQFNIYSPKSLAHIRGLDDVLEDRCIRNVNRRALNKEIKNSWPNNEDKNFEKIRSLNYRLYLDYSEEILSFKEEAEKLLPVNGRERLLWTPIMTLAIFFEKHGISGLSSKISEYIIGSSQDRKYYDEQESRDIRILQFIDKLAVNFAQNKEMINGNPLGWIPHMVLFKELQLRAEEYDINVNYFTKKTLSETLTNLGIKKDKKQAGYSWLITRPIIDEIKQRLEIDQESKNMPSDITSFSAEGSESTD